MSAIPGDTFYARLNEHQGESEFLSIKTDAVFKTLKTDQESTQK